MNLDLIIGLICGVVVGFGVGRGWAYKAAMNKAYDFVESTLKEACMPSYSLEPDGKILIYKGEAFEKKEVQ